jgi:hypothetical protein
MSDGKWSGGVANRNWTRPGSRLRLADDSARALRLWQLMKHERFLCETCGKMHELIEHRLCREQEAAHPNSGRLPRAIRLHVPLRPATLADRRHPRSPGLPLHLPQRCLRYHEPRTPRHPRPDFERLRVARYLVLALRPVAAPALPDRELLGQVHQSGPQRMSGTSTAAHSAHDTASTTTRHGRHAGPSSSSTPLTPSPARPASGPSATTSTAPSPATCARPARRAGGGRGSRSTGWGPSRAGRASSGQASFSCPVRYTACTRLSTWCIIGVSAPHTRETR